MRRILKEGKTVAKFLNAQGEVISEINLNESIPSTIKVNKYIILIRETEKTITYDVEEVEQEEAVTEPIVQYTNIFDEGVDTLVINAEDFYKTKFLSAYELENEEEHGFGLINDHGHLMIPLKESNGDITYRLLHAPDGRLEAYTIKKTNLMPGTLLHFYSKPINDEISVTLQTTKQYHKQYTKSEIRLIRKGNNYKTVYFDDKIIEISRNNIGAIDLHTYLVTCLDEEEMKTIIKARRGDNDVIYREPIRRAVGLSRHMITPGSWLDRW